MAFNPDRIILPVTATVSCVWKEPSVALDPYKVLGVPRTATEAEIKEAYGRQMRLAHPDKGGTSGLAAQLNAARDRLLKK